MATRCNPTLPVCILWSFFQIRSFPLSLRLVEKGDENMSNQNGIESCQMIRKSNEIIQIEGIGSVPPLRQPTQGS
jgi:hypothetical protein